MKRCGEGRWPRVLRVPGALVVSLLVIAGAASCGDDDGEGDGSLLGMVRTPALEVGHIELLDVSGADPAPRPMRAPTGELYLIYFGFTSCPDICPTTMSDISVAVRDLPAESAERVTVGMVTVDPERDTPEVLAGYLRHFFDSSLPLQATDADALDEAAEAFGVRFEVADHDPGDAYYEVAHSAITYVVDDTGTVVVEWPFGFDNQQMTSDLTTLLGDRPLS
jgi:protein SCO1